MTALYLLSDHSSQGVLIAGCIAVAEISASEDSPAQARGGSERCFHASTFPLLERNSSSCVASLRLWGRRAPARGIPMLRGKTCPSFARSLTRSCAARRRASAPSQGTTYWAHEGRGSAGSRKAARNAEYRSRCTGPMPQAHWCQRCQSGFLTVLPQP